MKAFVSILFMAAFFCSCGNDAPPNDMQNSNIVFKDNDGHILTATDLASATGQVNYEITDNKTIDPKAKKLHEEARQLGQAGKYDEGILKLREAMALQPDWAYPPYDLAYTYMLKANYDSAYKYYKRTDDLEPKGFFTSKTAVYALEGERPGKFPKGLYALYLQLEWADADKKMELAKTITSKAPDFAPAWKYLANMTEDETEKLKLIETGLAKDPDEETKGILLINKAIALANSNKKDEAKNILGKLIFSPDVTTGNLELAKFTLRSVL